MSNKHSAQHSRGYREIRCSKKNPRDANGNVSREPTEESSREMVRPRPMLKHSANNPFNDEIRSVKQTPYYKSPGRAVPKAAERNVKIIAQECGKRDMPAPPEVGKPNGGVRKTEIIFQMKTKTQRGADSAGGITGKIKKYLAGECHDTQPGIQCDEWPSVTKNAVGRTREHRIGEHDFFE